MTNRLVGESEAIAILRAGGLVAIPTETVYGLAARADDARAVASIFEAKGRPTGHPLIVHLASADALPAWAAEIPPVARRLADVLWPGPLTLVMNKREDVLSEITGGRSTIALRVPRHAMARRVIEAVGVGLAAPSANTFGRVSPTTAAHVMGETFAHEVAVLDGGASEVGLESTILDVTSGIPTLLRPGGVAVETIEEILGAPIADGRSGEARAPGMLASHYAPRAKVIVVASATEAAAIATTLTGETAFLGSAPIDHARLVRVDPDPAARARDLYAQLRALDDAGVSAILVELPSEGGLGLAIADRIRRAAHA